MSGAPGDLGDGVWDAVVVGAGPAGSLCARQLALGGRRVLLVERSVFPRAKVCGACLGAGGVGVLERAGMGGLLDELGAAAVRRTRLVWRGRSLRVPMRGMVTVSRRAMDAALAHAAERAGAVFVQGVRASWDGAAGIGSGPVAVRLESDERAVEARTRSLVIAGGLRTADADGVAGASVDERSWIGLGASGPAGDAGVFGADELTMVAAPHGYVGRIVTEDGVANWAAAVDPRSLRRFGGPAGAVRAIMENAGLAGGLVGGLDAGPPGSGWTGTPALTRRTPAQRGCVYRVGDAAGYVEPITGEGMTWALLGAAALAPMVEAAIGSGRHEPVWAARHASLLRVRRARCRLVARSLRSPLIMRAAFLGLGSGGAVGEMLVNRLIGAPGVAGRA